MTHHEGHHPAGHHAGGRPLAVVTGASSGIGRELAKLCVEHGHDLIIAADQPQIHDAASELRGMGAMVEPVQADLATDQGVESVLAAIGHRPVAVLMANAGHGLGGGFLDQNPAEWRHVVDTNITGTLMLIQKVAQEMRSHGEGRILITGSIAGFTPGTFQAVYNGTKAFIDSFSWALRNELQDSGVTVTCLMPGATETEFFERAGMEDTKVGASKKDDPRMVAETGYAAMERGDGDIVAGWHNKIATALASITPAAIGAAVHRRGAEPGSAKS